MTQSTSPRSPNASGFRTLRQTDISGVRWFLSATVTTSLFVTLVRHNFWKDSFDLAAIVRIELIAILLGWLFSVVMLAAMLSIVNKLGKAQTIDSDSGRRSNRHLGIEAPIVLNALRMDWMERLHFAAVSIAGSRLRFFRTICLTLILIAPATVYSLKTGWIIGNSGSPESVAATLSIAVIAIAVLIGIAIALRLMPISERMKTKFYRITKDNIESHTVGGLKATISWNSVNRIYLTTRFFGIEADARLVLAVSRRAIESALIDRIEKLVKANSE